MNVKNAVNDGELSKSIINTRSNRKESENYMMGPMEQHKKLDTLLKDKIVKNVYYGANENWITIAFNDRTFIDFKLDSKYKIRLQSETDVNKVKLNNNISKDDIDYLISTLQEIRENI